MPITIGEVESTVEVDAASAPAGNAPRPLPSSREIERMAQLTRHLQWDEARTAARDFDD